MNQLVETKAFSLIDEDYQAYLDRIPDRKSKIMRRVNRSVAGMDSAAPLLCKGPHKCSIFDFCPVPDRNEDGEPVIGSLQDYPVGHQCVLEKLYMVQKVTHLIEHLNVKLDDPVEMAIIQELAVIDLYKNRAQMFLSRGDKDGAGQDFMKTDITGFDDLGNKATNSKLHPLVDMIDKLEKRRAGWLDKLNATRQAKEKQKHTTEGSQIVDELVKLRKALTNIDIEEAQEVTFGMSD